MSLHKITFFCFFTFSLLEARHGELEVTKQEIAPWLTGPLLCPSGHVIPLGHQNYEPYVYFAQNRGHYDSHWAPHSTPHFHSALIQPLIQLGVLPLTEFDLAPQFQFNENQGQNEWRVSDLPIVLGIQVLSEKTTGWQPAIKLRLGLNLPLGKYDRLKAHKKGTDSAGSGAWTPGAGLVITKLFHFSGVHFLAARSFINYNFTVPVSVHGLSSYGGAPTTQGTVYTGGVFTGIAGFEYTLSQNWALALDIAYNHNWKTRFSGHSGGLAPSSPSSDSLSLAPAIEYNFNEQIGVIAGPWMSVAGRNSTQFVQWVFAINIYN